MDLESKIDLIKRNTVEIVTEEELRVLLETKDNPVAYCGYEPSGPLHLGHLVTVTKLRDLEASGFKVKILLADLHALLNLKGDKEFINKQVKVWKKTVKLLGLKNPEYVIGSDYQLEGEYWQDVMQMATKTTLKRGLRAMQEVARDIDNANISQIMYPLLQTNDIKYLEVDVAQSGIDQRKIHMLAREQLTDIGWKAPVCVHTPLLNSLLGPGTKMSSSIEGSNISVIESEATIKSRMKKAYCQQGEIKNNPVLEIAKLIVFPQLNTLTISRKPKFGGDVTFAGYEELETAFKENSIHPLDMKMAIASALNTIIDPIREQFSKI